MFPTYLIASIIT